MEEVSHPKQQLTHLALIACQSNLEDKQYKRSHGSPEKSYVDFTVF